MTRQRLGQLARTAAGRCYKCEKPLTDHPSLCNECHGDQVQYTRERRKRKAAASYEPGGWTCGSGRQS